MLGVYCDQYVLEEIKKLPNKGDSYLIEKIFGPQDGQFEKQNSSQKISTAVRENCAKLQKPQRKGVGKITSY